MSKISFIVFFLEEEGKSYSRVLLSFWKKLWLDLLVSRANHKLRKFCGIFHNYAKLLLSQIVLLELFQCLHSFYSMSFLPILAFCFSWFFKKEYCKTLISIFISLTVKHLYQFLQISKSLHFKDGNFKTFFCH